MANRTGRPTRSSLNDPNEENDIRNPTMTHVPKPINRSLNVISGNSEEEPSSESPCVEIPGIVTFIRGSDINL